MASLDETKKIMEERQKLRESINYCEDVLDSYSNVAPILVRSI